MNAAVLAGMALDRRAFVDDLELFRMRRDLEIGDGDNADDREYRAGRLPALGAATGVVMRDITCNGDFDLVGRAMAMQRAAAEAGNAGSDSIIYCWVKSRSSHLRPSG